jgi:membrane-anchored glycerophosphoryl diester phosphodiesterase (GDPDase)
MGFGFTISYTILLLIPLFKSGKNTIITKKVKIETFISGNNLSCNNAHLVHLNTFR